MSFGKVVCSAASFYAAAAAFEFGHKVFALNGSRTRIMNRDFHAYRYSSSCSSAALERSRPLLVTERVLVTAIGMALAPLMAPMHVADDIVQAEARMRGFDGPELRVLPSWEYATFL